MNFQLFKDTLEEKLSNKLNFELQEFHYLPYSFGSGLLVYRINGYNYKITYNGKEEIITIEKSGYHEKYFGCKWTIISELETLNDVTINKAADLFKK